MTVADIEKKLGNAADIEAGPCKRCQLPLSFHYEALGATEEERGKLPEALLACISGKDGEPTWFVKDEAYELPPGARALREAVSQVNSLDISLSDLNHSER